MDPQKGDPLYSSGWILKKAFQVDPQKGDPRGSPKRRSRWIPKKAIHSIPNGWILKKAIQVDPQKGDPLYPYPLLTEWIPKKLVHSILTFMKWIPKMGNRFKMDPQKSYTIHLVDPLSFAVS